MVAPKLVLHPDCRTQSLSAAAILKALRELEMLGTAFQLDGRQHFLPGSAFLEHLSFLGCAPAIALEPPPEAAEAAARAGRFCHLHLYPVTPQTRIRIRAGQWPRCRGCRTDIGSGVTATDPGEVICPGCGARTQAVDLNWRQAGGIARIFLDVYGIHTGEAVPGDRLLSGLAQASGGTWTFFYIED